MTLQDALVAGGYVFRQDDATGDMVDADGITLSQRKNNLCRRLRIERDKLKEEAAAVVSTSETFDAVDDIDSTDSGIAGVIESQCSSGPQCNDVPFSSGFHRNEEDDCIPKPSLSSDYDVGGRNRAVVSSYTTHTDESITNYPKNNLHGINWQRNVTL